MTALPQIQFLALVGVSAVIFTVVLYSVMNGGDKRKQSRFSTVKKRFTPGPVTFEAEIEESIYKNDKSKNPLIRALNGLIPHPDRLRARLEQTGTKLSIAGYALASLFAGLIGGFVGYTLMKWSSTMSLFFGLATMFWLPKMVIGFLVSRRQQAFTQSFPEAIDLMVRGIKSGLPITECMNAVGNEMRGPLAQEFRELCENQKLGQTFDQALKRMAVRVGTAEAKFFVTALAVQRETGGNLAETLQNLSKVLRDRYQMKQKIKALSAEPRASAMILGSLPFIMFLIIFLVNSSYVMELFNDPRGHGMVWFGVGMQFVGIVVMARMIRFEI